MTITAKVFLRNMLMIAGSASAIAGISIAFYSIFVAAPRLSRSSHRLAAALLSTPVANHTSTGLLSNSVDSLIQSGRLIRSAPELIRQTENTLRQTSSLLNSAGGTVQKTTHGVTGIVAPDKSLRQNASQMSNTAQDLQSLADTLSPLGQALTRMSSDFSEILGSAGTNAETNVQTLAHRIDQNRLPLYVALWGTATGGLILSFGLCFFSLALVVERTSEGSFVLSIPPQFIEASSKKRAA